jgi:hypothetical protein
MVPDLKNSVLFYLKAFLALAPLIGAMYTLYYFGKYEVWIPETPHRDKITIAVLVLGFFASFWLYSLINPKKNA